MAGSVTYNSKYTVVEASAAAASTNLTGDEVDTAGYDGIKFYALVTAASSVSTCSLKAQSAASTTCTFYDIAGSTAEYAAGPTTRTNLLITHVHKPIDRWVRPYLTLDVSNHAVGGIFAELYGPKTAPVTSTSSDVYYAFTCSASTS
jgi:hypothetical protein